MRRKAERAGDPGNRWGLGCALSPFGADVKPWSSKRGRDSPAGKQTVRPTRVPPVKKQFLDLLQFLPSCESPGSLEAPPLDLLRQRSWMS